MESIKLRETDETPLIILDTEREIFEISGRSLPEDVNQFYDPILKWLDEYSKNPLPKSTFLFKLTYFNTASSKLVLDIMMKIENMHDAGHEVLIKWLVPFDDEDNEEAGEEFKDMLDVPFEITILNE